MKKLNLKELKVKSFVTSLDNTNINTVKGQGHGNGAVKIDPDDWVTNGEKCEPTGALQCDTYADLCEYYPSQYKFCGH